MKIKYTLDKNNYEVLIKKDISSHIIKDLEKIGSDKKILIIYDEKIDGNFLKKIFIILHTYLISFAVCSSEIGRLKIFLPKL